MSKVERPERAEVERKVERVDRAESKVEGVQAKQTESKVERVAKSEKRPFLAFLLDGLKSVDNGLGDRRSYVGASDIGGCLKKAYLSKRETKATIEAIETKEETQTELSLEQMIVMQRGHIAEGIVNSALKAKGLSYKSQVEIVGKNELSFIKAHLDFIVENGKEIVAIECKSITSSITSPYDSWVYQIQLQLGLLKATTAKSVRGVIAAINVSDGSATEFAVSFNEPLFYAAVARAKQLWASMNTNVEPEGECGALCSYCPFKGQCQTLRSGASELPEEMALKVNRLKALSGREKEIKSLKDEIKSYLEAANVKKATAGPYTVSVVYCKGKPSIDTEKLKELAGEDVLAECVSEGDSYSYLKAA
jgi:CRISPR-associated exonuclease Cas4